MEQKVVNWYCSTEAQKQMQSNVKNIPESCAFRDWVWVKSDTLMCEQSVQETGSFTPGISFLLKLHFSWNFDARDRKVFCCNFSPVFAVLGKNQAVFNGQKQILKFWFLQISVNDSMWFHGFNDSRFVAEKPVFSWLNFRVFSQQRFIDKIWQKNMKNVFRQKHLAKYNWIITVILGGAVESWEAKMSHHVVALVIVIVAFVTDTLRIAAARPWRRQAPLLEQAWFGHLNVFAEKPDVKVILQLQGSIWWKQSNWHGKSHFRWVAK